MLLDHELLLHLLILALGIAGYLRMRGLPESGAAHEPAPSPAKGVMPPDEADESDGEVAAVNETLAPPGNTNIPFHETIKSSDEIVAINHEVGGLRGHVRAQPAGPYKDDISCDNTVIDRSTAFLDIGQQEKAFVANTEATTLLRVVHDSPTFNTVGTSGGRIINVNGPYITGDEGTVAKILRILPYADGASWDPHLTCLPGTRVSVLSIIEAWAQYADSERVYWMKGVAGSGKSAILHTIAQMLQRAGRLGSAFFFSRDTTSRNTPSTLFTTIARDLASLHPSTAASIARALEAEPALVSASLSRQFDALILGPSRHLPCDRPIVLIIDALDESISHDLDTVLLAILRDKAPQLPPQLRILIASRPTSTIEEYLSGRSHVMTHSIDIFSAENSRDIAAYVDAQLRDKAILTKMGLTTPDETMIRNLQKSAEGLFVWAVTVCNFLRTAYKPTKKLQALLSKAVQHLPPERKIDQLYAAILAECGDWEDADFRKDYDLVMGTIVAAKRPLSLAAVRALHDGSQELDPEQLLQRFGSVLIGFRDPSQPIRILHLSFKEFITDRAAHDDSTKHFYISEKAHSARLAELCIKTLNRELTKPIAGTGYLTEDSEDIPGIPRIMGASEQVVYGSAHWTDHLPDVEELQMIRSHVITLISHHFFTWIEIAASTDVFRGSLAIRQWLQQRIPELDHYFQQRSHAPAMSALSSRLAHEARPEEALLAAQETLGLWRARVPERPAEHNNQIAIALADLSDRLATLGRAQDALGPVQEAVGLYRTLAAQWPGSYNTALAAALHGLSQCLSALGRAREALSANQELVDLQRTRAAEQPAEYRADLAAGLSSLSVRLSALGRAQEALSASEESVDLYRTLAAERPAEYNAGFAVTLGNLSNHLLAIDRAKDALAAARESVDLHRALAAARPAAHNAGLATALNSLSVHLGGLDRAQEAVAAAQESVDLLRALAAGRPAAHNAGLAMVLNSLSILLLAFGQTRDARAAAAESAGLLRALAEERPAAHNAGLAIVLNNLSYCLVDLGRREEALGVILEAVALRRALAAEQPALYMRPLMEILASLATVLDDLGLEGSGQVAREAAALRGALERERHRG
ncbi:hypothetical protein HWV62_20453 [Athelia sp. TMB]|nr:hypothetical protein HWV62_20453 [Athelia sp. TMB]